MNLIDRAKNQQDIINAAAILTTDGVRNIIGMHVEQDDKNSAKMMVQLNQTGLGLPNRDYYFRTDARTSHIRDDYTSTYLPTLLKLSGWTNKKQPQAQKALTILKSF